MPVYMIQGENRFGPIKIGHSHDPEIRLGQIQISHWEALRIIRRFEGGEMEEVMLHQRFSDLYMRGEWHSFSRAMLGDVGLVEIDAPAVITYGRAPKAPSTRRPPSDMSHHNKLLSEVEAFLATRNIAETTFGKVAVNDGKFVSRLRGGSNMTLATIERVRGFINANSQVAQ
jgi:hypothetical protein